MLTAFRLRRVASTALSIVGSAAQAWAELGFAQIGIKAKFRRPVEVLPLPIRTAYRERTLDATSGLGRPVDAYGTADVRIQATAGLQVATLATLSEQQEEAVSNLRRAGQADKLGLGLPMAVELARQATVTVDPRQQAIGGSASCGEQIGPYRTTGGLR
jgi:hypothetical protein